MFIKSQKMLIFPVISLLVSMAYSCVSTGEKKSTSQWQDLEKNGLLTCYEWPVQQSELDVSDMLASPAGNGLFVATMRLRNGSSLPVLAEMNGRPKVDTQKMKRFPVGRDARVVAISEWMREPVAFVIQNKNDRAWLEVRAMRDNKLVSRMASPLGDGVQSGNLSSSKSGWWLQLNHSESQSSFVYVVPDKGPNWKFVISSFQSSSKLPLLVSDASESAGFVVESSRGQDADLGEFVVSRLESTGRFLNFGKTTIATKGGIESWSAAMIDRSLILSIVRGDSMVGQASLLIVATGGGGAVLWKREFPMPDVHLGDPVWLGNGSKALLGLIQWIDAEGSLRRIKVDKFGAEQLTDVGVFAKGSVLVAGYLDSDGLAGFRHRENDLWKYKICKIPL
jgi:hypothetical protein